MLKYTSLTQTMLSIALDILRETIRSGELPGKSSKSTSIYPPDYIGYVTQHLYINGLSVIDL